MHHEIPYLQCKCETRSHSPPCIFIANISVSSLCLVPLKSKRTHTTIIEGLSNGLKGMNNPHKSFKTTQQSSGNSSFAPSALFVRTLFRQMLRLLRWGKIFHLFAGRCCLFGFSYLCTMMTLRSRYAMRTCWYVHTLVGRAWK